MQKMINEFIRYVQLGDYTHAFVMLTLALLLFKGKYLYQTAVAIVKFTKDRNCKLKLMRAQAKTLLEHPVMSSTHRLCEFVSNDANLSSYIKYSRGASDWAKRKKFVKILLSTKAKVFNKLLLGVVKDFNIRYLANDKAGLTEIINKDFWFDIIAQGTILYRAEAEALGLPKEALDVFECYHKATKTILVEFTDQFIDAPLVSDIEAMRGILNLYDFAFSIVKSDIGLILELNGELSSALENMEV